MGRAPCCEKNGLKRGPWTPEEDQKLMDYIQKNGYGSWRTLPKNAGLQRCGKSCRLRWTNYLRPDIKRGRFSFEEEETIIQLHSILGNKWSAIAGRLPGRTDNEIKNYWNTHIRKRLLRMGIDPVTHSPRLDLLDLSTILNSSLYANHHSQSQINFSRLLGMQPALINPDLIRLASSLLSSERRSQQGFLPPQNHLITNSLQICNNNAQVSHSLAPTTSAACPLTEQDGNPQLMQYDDVGRFGQNPAGFGEWQQNDGSVFSAEYAELASYGYYGSDQSVVDSSNNNNNFSFQSVLSNISTPSSSPAPLNSGSNYIGVGGTEDERESYCSNMLKFEIPAEMLDVADFI